MKHPDYVAIKKPGASKSKKSMANQNDTTKPKAPAELSSSELFGRVRELEQECEEILRCLIDHGQMVAANKMDDAVTGLHKTKSCWNNVIEWKRPNSYPP